MQDAKNNHGVSGDGVKDKISTHRCDPRSLAEVVARSADARKIPQQVNRMEDPFDHRLGRAPTGDVDEMAADIDYVLLGRRQDDYAHDLLAAFGKPGADAGHGFGRRGPLAALK